MEPSRRLNGLQEMMHGEAGWPILYPDVASGASLEKRRLLPGLIKSRVTLRCSDAVRGGNKK